MDRTESTARPDGRCISGLVITFCAEPGRREQAIARVAAHPCIETGPGRECWLPVAVDASDEDESRQIHDWLLSLDGVEFVDVVSISFASESLTTTN